jgi:hypothetical protein
MMMMMMKLRAPYCYWHFTCALVLLSYLKSVPFCLSSNLELKIFVSNNVLTKSASSHMQQTYAT